MEIRRGRCTHSFGTSGVVIRLVRRLIAVRFRPTFEFQKLQELKKKVKKLYFIKQFSLINQVPLRNPMKASFAWAGPGNTLSAT
jgi:hypothetical protein